MSAVIVGRYRVTAFLGSSAEMTIVGAQSLPPALADHGTSDVVLRVLNAREPGTRSVFARDALANARVVDFGQLDDGRLYCAENVHDELFEDELLTEIAA